MYSYFFTNDYCIIVIYLLYFFLQYMYSFIGLSITKMTIQSKTRSCTPPANKKIGCITRQLPLGGAQGMKKTQFRHDLILKWGHLRNLHSTMPSPSGFYIEQNKVRTTILSSLYQKVLT